MIFGNDAVFYLLFLMIPAAYFFFRDEKMRMALLSRWTKLKDLNHLTGPVSKSRRLIQKYLELLCCGLIICALAHPLFGKKQETVKRKGVDVVIAMDVSSSMLAEDYLPNRLQKAKQELHTLLDRIQGHRIGLIAFAGHAAMLCPMTTDTATVQTYLEVLDTQLFDHQGTALSDAIQKSVGMFDKTVSRGKAIVLITDGENHEEDPLKAARQASEAGIHIYCIGIGSAAGEPIPIFNESGEKKGHKRDEKGEVVLTKLDEDTLNQISSVTGGKYFRASLNEMEVEAIFNDISQLEKGEFGKQDIFRYDEIFQIPLLWAFLGFLWAEALGFRPGLIKKLFSQGTGIFRSKSVKIALFIIVLFIQFGFTKSSDMEEANKLYSESKYDEAAQKYLNLLKSHPGNPKIIFNLANTLYQKKNYSEAQKHYREVKNTREPSLISQAEYSIGNSYFKKNQFDKALSHYKKAIELDPNDFDSKYNYEISLQKIKDEKEKQDQEKQKKEDQKKQQDQEKKQKQEQNQEKQQRQNQQNQEKKQTQQQKQQEGQEKQEKQQQTNQEEQEKGQQKEQQENVKQDKKQKEQEQEKKEEKRQKQKDKEKKERKGQQSQKTKVNSRNGNKKEKASNPIQETDSKKKEGNEMTQEEALELLEVGHNDKKDLLYNLLRSQQEQNPSKKGKDW